MAVSQNSPGADAPAVLEMVDITKEFPGVKALANVSLTVRRGEIHAICGENGAGKSTLMKVLSGVHPYGTYTGKIFFDGKESQFKGMQERIDAWDLRLAKRKETLTRQFTAMETSLSSLRNQSTWLAGQINSLPSG